MSELPGARITAAERDRALRELAEHLGAGRLTITEYEERVTTATAATTTPELAAVFSDLPGAPPVSEPLPDPGPEAGVVVMAGAGTVGAFILALAFGGWLWLVLLVVVLVSAPVVPALLRHYRTTGQS